MLRLFLIPAALTVLAATSLAGAEPATVDLADVSKQILEQTNAFRGENQLVDAKRNDALTQAAEEFAQFMAKTGKYGHEADGRTPAHRVEAAGYQCAVVLENIQMQYSSRGFSTDELANRAVEGWKNSPGHRKNMLDADVTETGVGVARSDDGHYYGVQLFAHPQSAAIKFSISNKTPGEVQYKLMDKTFTLPPLATRQHTISRPAKLEFAATRDKPQSIDVKSASTYVVKQDGAETRVVESTGK